MRRRTTSNKYKFVTDMKLGYQKKEKIYFHIDASKMILGRLASIITHILMNKHKTDYIPTTAIGDCVVVTNINEIRLSGKKLNNKTYTRYSGYPGGLKLETARKIYEKDPCELVKRAVKGMLPDNKLKKERLKRLFLFREQHNFPSSIRLIPYGFK